MANFDLISKRFIGQWLLFGDGASSGNPGTSGWAAIVLSPHGDLLELSGYEFESTNNRMELTAIIQGLGCIPKPGTVEVQVLTDSSYVIHGVRSWRWGWQKRGWKTQNGGEVANRDLWEGLFKKADSFKAVHWGYIPGHAGFPGNERVDQLAVAQSQNKPVRLHRGGYLEYPYDLSKLPDSLEPPPMKPQSDKKVTGNEGQVYLSVVNGKLERHATWKECELRVKGQSGARYQKAKNAEEEEEILKKWGF